MGGVRGWRGAGPAPTLSPPASPPRTTSSLPRAPRWQSSFPYKPCLRLASWQAAPYPQLISLVSVAHGVSPGPEACPFAQDVPFPGLSPPPTLWCPCARCSSGSPPCYPDRPLDSSGAEDLTERWPLPPTWNGLVAPRMPPRPATSEKRVDGGSDEAPFLGSGVRDTLGRPSV